jgi:hypothetical protein
VRRLGYAAIVLLNLIVLVVGLVGVGLWRRYQAIPIRSHIEGTITQGFFERAEDVGYIPRPDQHVTAKRVTEDGVTVYDVAYTIGADQFRVTPPVPAPGACVAVFGDSFAFGEGLNEGETLPALLVAGGNGRVAAQNFGIGGWGPHQMLGGLMSGRFQRALTCQPTVALYTLIGGHMRRLAGRDDWFEGPRFRLEADGKVVRDGSLRDGRHPAPDRLDEGFLGWRRLRGVSNAGTLGDVALTAAVFRDSLGHLERLATRPRLHVLYLDINPTLRVEELLHRLVAQGIVLHRLEAMIPDFAGNRLHYVLGPADAHLNARANRLIARYVGERIVGR